MGRSASNLGLVYMGCLEGIASVTLGMSFYVAVTASYRKFPTNWRKRWTMAKVVFV